MPTLKSGMKPMTDLLDRSRLYGYTALAWFASTRLRQLDNAQINVQLHRQIFVIGIRALPVICALAAITGALAMTQVTGFAGQDSDLAQRVLFFGLFFEMAPLLSALVLVARSSASLASDLAVMNMYGEFTTLRRMGVPPADYLLLPRIIGFALALPAVTVCFQLTAVASGWVAMALLQNQPLLEASGHFLAVADPLSPVVSLLKGFVTGAAVGVIACYHGTSLPRSTQAVSEAGIQAVGNGMVAVFLIDIAFAVAAYLLK